MNQEDNAGEIIVCTPPVPVEIDGASTELSNDVLEILPSVEVKEENEEGEK